MIIFQTEQKISCMILDGKLSGIIDQQTRTLTIFPLDKSQEHDELEQATGIFDILNNIINNFYNKASGLFQ